MKGKAEQIKEVRKSANLSQDEFAEKIGVARQTVSKWEQGIAEPTPKYLKKICQVFCVPVELFFEVSKEEEAAGVPKKQSVFYKKNKKVEGVILVILLTALLFILGWAVISFVAMFKMTGAGDNITKSLIYYISIFAVVAAAIIITLVYAAKNVFKKDKNY